MLPHVVHASDFRDAEIRIVTVTSTRLATWDAIKNQHRMSRCWVLLPQVNVQTCNGTIWIVGLYSNMLTVNIGSDPCCICSSSPLLPCSFSPKGELGDATSPAQTEDQETPQATLPLRQPDLGAKSEIDP